MNIVSIETVDCIPGVIEKKLPKHLDHRGHLIETFRIDELPEEVRPVMSYVNLRSLRRSSLPYVSLIPNDGQRDR
jgi:dTDP-4-dehydrorhamnose 3,5-epimerase-like enzyme